MGNDLFNAFELPTGRQAKSCRGISHNPKNIARLFFSGQLAAGLLIKS
jgi:hypothetical protein